MKKIIACLLTVLFLIPGFAASEEPAVPAEPIVSPQELVERAVDLYAASGSEKMPEVEELLDALETLYPDLGPRWREIFRCWQQLEEAGTDTRLPEGLPDDGSLCIVVLGYQLNADGSMREELYKRLRVTLACAEQYPNAYILCTGGHTASENAKASEAGRMAKWLIRNGIPAAQVIAEESSLTTSQNAVYTHKILTERYPSVTAVAVISSDYHVVSGAVLLEAMSLLNAPSAAEAPYSVLACAGCPMRSGVSRSFAVSGLKSFARKYA